MDVHRIVGFANRGAATMLLAAMCLTASGCGHETPSSPPRGGTTSVRPSILLVTLDTTRADAVGPDATGVRTPSFNALVARGQRFRQAYATVPETLPSHISMLTGLYPAGHGIHENGRTLAASHPLVTERLKQAGYRTMAFVSSFTLAKRFGLGRGFDVYADDLPVGQSERTARDTTDRVVAALQQPGAGPVFLWVHYFDPHYPYVPPEPYLSRYRQQPYLGEVAAMDEQLGRLVDVFEQAAPGPKVIIVAGDHGEGLGEHGEYLHGNLLYQSTMHVPFVVVGPGVRPGVQDSPVSTRRVFHTILGMAGLGAQGSLLSTPGEVVLGEAMRPFLAYGWQPQTMGIDGRHKTILAGRVEQYDVLADPSEQQDLTSTLSATMLPLVPPVLRDYPVPSPAAAKTPDALDPQARKELASLGYVSAGAAPLVRKDAPRAADMTRLFATLDRASGLFVTEQYAQVIPILEGILKADPYNLDAVLRLATAHAALGHERRADEVFKKAVVLAPDSADVRAYLALHDARGAQWERAVPMLESVLAAEPDRLPVLEALAAIRERQGRLDEALALRQRVVAMRAPTAADLGRIGMLAMEVGQTAAAIAAFEQARAQGGGVAHDLELGALYLASKQFVMARDALDRVPSSHPDYAMLLFKRAQVSVLLNEPDRAARVGAARQHADAGTRELVARERLFQGL
jgi:choline-sulfatase